MSAGRSWRAGGRITAVGAASAVVLSGLSIVVPTSVASAAGTVLFQNAFNDRTVDGTGTVTVPPPASGTNTACLTVSGNTTVKPLSCSGAADAQGSGVLRLTSLATSQVGGVFGQTSFPTSNGLDVTFTSYQYGGTAADGISFVLAAVDPANPVPPARLAATGGSLGYTPQGAVSGLTAGYLGVGLDAHGTYSNPAQSGPGCTSITGMTGQAQGALAVRGPGNGLAGYCDVATTYDGTAGSKLVLEGTSRATSAVPVEALINPTNAAFTSASGYTVAAGAYKIVVTPIGQSTKVLTGALPSVPAGLYPSSTWLNANGVPKQLAFGFFGSTGALTDVHEISNATVLTFSSVPQLSVASTSYSSATVSAGGPITYTTTAGVITGTNESNPISVTQTVPTGAVPVGAFGTGWVCGAALGTSITCTTSASSFTNGTTLPEITVVAIATTTLTAATIQAGSSALASASDANPGVATSASAGSLPAAPSGVAVAPAISSIAGGILVAVTGTNIGAATAIEIGTTAQQQAGTPITLLPCAGLSAPGCFTSVLGALAISSMPAVATAATVSVTVVTNGLAADASYVYADKPATPAAPTATAGLTSATVSWTAPAANGSAITGYTLTPYLAGVAQSPLIYDATTTTRALSGLVGGGSYTFTVSATNLFGTSGTSATSAAVIAYTLPAAPTITSAVAGSTQATLGWSAPNNGGSAITAYVVTPYIGLVAQATQTFGAGLTQTVVGLTSGTTYTFRVAAKNVAGTGPASAASSAVTPNSLPTLTGATLAVGEVGAAYSAALAVTGGTAPFAWSVSAGALPPGLTVSAATGAIAGTPTAAGGFTFTVAALDASSKNANAVFTMTVLAAPAVTFAPSGAQAAIAFVATPSVTGGTAPFTWSMTGAVPGLTIAASTGALTGTPTTPGSYPITVTATDARGVPGSASVTLVVATGPIVISQGSDTSAPVASGRVTYTITVMNTGSIAQSGIAFTESLSGILDDGVYGSDVHASSGTVTYTAPQLGWSGSLAAGAAATVTFSVHLNDPIVGDGVLQATAVGTSIGTQCGAGSTDPRCSTTLTVAPLSITLSGLTSSFTLSGAPHTTANLNGATTMTVTTNDPAGYRLTVRAGSTALTMVGGSVSFPVGTLGIRASGQTAFTPLSATVVTEVAGKSGASDVGGDRISADYSATMPFTDPGTYSTTLDFVVGAL